MNNSYFSWSGNPVMFGTGSVELPFEISVMGLVLAIALYFFGYQYLDRKFNPKQDRAGKKRRSKQDEKKESLIPGWYIFGLVAGALVIGQALFAVLPFSGPGFSAFGPIEVRWYGFLFAMAFIVGYALGSAMFRHAGYPQKDADALLTYLFIGTLAGARLGEVLFYNPVYYFSNPLEIFMIWKGGLASHGAVIGNILAMWIYVKNRPHITYLWVLDRMTLPFAIGGAFVRLGNFFNTEIYGLETTVPWAVVFERLGDGIPRHPTMLYEALVGVFLFIVLWAVYKKWNNRPPEGALTGLFFTILFSFRFLLEITKVEQADFAVSWIVGMGQLLSIPIVMVGLYILFRMVNWKGTSTETKTVNQNKD